MSRIARFESLANRIARFELVKNSKASIRIMRFEIAANRHRVLQGGGAQRGAQFHFIFAVLWTLFSCSKMSLFYLKTYALLRDPPEAPLETGGDANRCEPLTAAQDIRAPYPFSNASEVSLSTLRSVTS